MGPDDPFSNMTQTAANPEGEVTVAAPDRSMERKVVNGALAGALLALIGVVWGPGAALSVAALGALGALFGVGLHLATSSWVRAWLVRLLDDRA
jgi:hypothetical protein